MIHFIIRRGQKRKFNAGFRCLLNVVVVLALVFYQVFLPLSLIRASADTNENTNSTETVQTENSNDNNSNDNKDNNNDNKDNENENQNKNENDNNSNDNQSENSSSCEVKDSELTDSCQQDLGCGDVDKCLVKHTCGEIKKCLSVKIENDNNANINDNVSTEANSGENQITQAENSPDANNNKNSNSNANCNDNSNPEPTAKIDTGDAAATANTYNEVNTNITSDNYQETTINIEGTYNGDINLLEQFENVAANDKESEIGSLTVINENSAEVTNNIDVNANTGGNTINTESGSAEIQTGDAGAVSNAVNVVNTNIVGNNVLFAVVNVYGEWNGDLIVPGEGLLTVSEEPVYAETVIVNENEADVINNVAVTSDTGNNSINQEGSSGTAEIVSGAAYAGSEVLNIVNTNIVKNNFFFLMINNLGSWTGKILNWNEENGTYSNVFTYDFGLLPDGASPTINGLLAIFNKNTATVENNVNVSANTGGNAIDSGSGSANIQTGNAAALSNNTGGNAIDSGSGSANIQTGNAAALSKIINFINTNIVGNNWIFAIVNVMGKWNGNAVFAYPDLTVAISDGKDQVGPGEALNYTVTYKNNGKAACDNANILVTVPSFFNTSDSLEHTFAGLKPGEEKSFNIKGIISSDIPEGNTNLEALAGIATGTKEVELGNNIGKDNTTAYRATSASLNEDKNEAINSGAGDEKLKSSLTITRKVKDKRIHAGDTAIYYIYIQNTGGTDLRDVVVTDNMRLKNTLMGTFSWNIGNMKAGSKYRIRYKLAINELAPAGVYRSTASGYGYDSKGNEVVANKDSQKITILGNTTYDNLAYNNYEYGQNMFQYGDSVITGGICYLDEWPALNEAQAAENPTFLAAADSNPSLPLWIWLAAILAYLLIVNWSLFPKKYFP